MWHILYPFTHGDRWPRRSHPRHAHRHHATGNDDGRRRARCASEDERCLHLIGQDGRHPADDRKHPNHCGMISWIANWSGCVKITGAQRLQRLRLRSSCGTTAADHHLHAGCPRQRKTAPSLSGMDCRCTQRPGIADRKRRACSKRPCRNKHMVPVCERTGQIVEPMLTDQWFVATSKPTERRQGPRRRAAGSRRGISPNTGRRPTTTWRTSDWCISRQLWWGHQ